MYTFSELCGSFPQSFPSIRYAYSTFSIELLARDLDETLRRQTDTRLKVPARPCRHVQISIDKFF